MDDTHHWDIYANATNEARLAEVERERDEWKEEYKISHQMADFYKSKCVKLVAERNEARARVADAYEEAAAAANLVSNGAHPSDFVDTIRALARPEETDALRRIVREERERILALVPDGSDEWYQNLRPPHVKRMLAVLRAAIRGDDT